MSWWIEKIAPSEGNTCATSTWVSSEKTSRTVLSLNGTWQFRLHPSAEVDQDQPWETIELPNHWVFTSNSATPHPHQWERGRPIYTNVKFPFPHQPPSVPQHNPTGEHLRTFEVEEHDLARVGSNGRVILRFHGVESIAHLQINNQYVGIARGSRLMNDFDITTMVKLGVNEIRVLVSQWSAMSYVEDQDQWWLPGIFRDVEVLFEPNGGIRDLRVQADWDPATAQGSLNVLVDSADPVAKVTVAGQDCDLPTGVWNHIECGKVTPWSAENPHLYDLEVETSGEKRTEKIGFRRVEVAHLDGQPQILVNGRKIVFRGVNRHETHPDRGRAFDEEQLRRDLRLMKRFHINAIRTSHYPPHPKFFELADELGFWVIAEGDIETHGFEYVGWEGNPSEDARWRDIYLDRAQRLVSRDFNHPSIIIWSLGNESGTGTNLAIAAHKIRSLDGSRLIHYEGDHEAAYTDVYSRMYCPLEEIEAICSDTGKIHRGSVTGQAQARQKPFLLCEYGHAMGNGPGGLKAYDEMAEKYPRFHGGFIWEWRDHGVRTWTEDAVEYFGYGGDFEEVVHDYNFVMDGLVTSSGEASPGLVEFGAVNTPILIDLDRRSDRTQIRIKNRFHTLYSDVTQTWMRVDQGESVRLAHRLAPGQSQLIDLPIGADAETIDITTTWAIDTWWARTGEEVAHAQWHQPRYRTPTPWVETEVEATAGEKGEKLAAPWDSLRPTFWRAPTDNDSLTTFGSYALAAPADSDGIGEPGAPSSAKMWRENGLDTMVCLKEETRSIRINGKPATRQIQTWAPPAHSHYVVVTSTWMPNENGGVKLLVEIVPSAGWEGTWPRTGIAFEVPKPLSLTWEGMGPGEAYADSRCAVYRGSFTKQPSEMFFAYAVPQENGSRLGMRSLRLCYGERDYLIKASADPSLPRYSDHLPAFSFLAWDEFELTQARHQHELKPEGDTYHLFIDAGQHGLGSRSCGPDVRPEYAWSPRAVRIELDIYEIPKATS